MRVLSAQAWPEWRDQARAPLLFSCPGVSALQSDGIRYRIRNDGQGLTLSLISSGLWPRQPIVYSREQSPDSVILSEVPGNDVLVQLVELVRKVVIDKQNLQRISYSYNMDVVTSFESRKRRKVTMDGDNGLGEEGGETAADRS